MKNVKLFAIWPYGQAFLGGTVTKMQEDGRVETKEYGKGFYFRPQYLLPVAKGKAFLAQIKKAGDARDDKIRLAEEEFHVAVAALQRDL